MTENNKVTIFIGSLLLASALTYAGFPFGSKGVSFAWYDDDLSAWWQAGGRYTISSYYHPSGTKYSIELYDYPRVSGFESYSEAANALDTAQYISGSIEDYHGGTVHRVKTFTKQTSNLWEGTEKFLARYEGTESGVLDTKQACRDWIDSQQTTQYVLTVSVNGQGTVQPESGTHTYNEGTKITVSITPSSGWKTDAIMLDGIQKEVLETITMNQDHSLEVTFIEDTPEPPAPDPDPDPSPEQPFDWGTVIDFGANFMVSLVVVGVIVTHTEKQ